MIDGPESVRRQHPHGELRQYEGGGVDQIYQTPGDTFSMGALVGELRVHPAAADAGTVVVETASPDGKQGKTYYFDGIHMLEEKGLFTKPEPLAEVPVYDAAFDITIGQPWRNPFGTTEPVVAVAVPYAGKVFAGDTQIQPAGERSLTARGRELMDQYTLTAGYREPVPGARNPSNN